jgi:parallel beta-helix repeat protein
MLDSAQVYINYRNKDSIYIQIYDATGSGGGPGGLLATDTLKLSGNNQYRWMSVSYTTRNVTVPTGKFYVCVKTPNSTVRFGLDQAQPVSRRTWEFTGSWTPYRGLERQDVMIRANVHKPGNSAIYVDAASGSDLNPGTSVLPLKTMTHALEVVSSTDSCYVRSGSYTGRLTFTPRHSGTATNRTVITAQAGHTPLLYSGGADGSLIDSAASYITFNGFTVYPGSLVSAYFQDAADVLFSNNRIYVPTMGYGLLAVGLTASLFKGNTVGPIADNVNPAEGIYLWATDQIRLDSNRVSGMIDAGIVLSMDDRTIACRNLVTGNLMGIALDMSGNDSIFNNTITGNGDAGIYSNGLMGSAATLNNIIAGNGYGFGWVDGGGALSSDYNDVWGNIYSDYNYGTYPVAAGANDISADPLYDASYHLLTGSPCINAGIAVGLPSVGAPDIGAFESGFKASPAGFGEDGGTANYRFGLWGSRPNPFRNTTTVVYSCPNPRAGEPAVQKVSLRVYNIAGQAVRTLVESAQSPGIHSVRWDGRDQSGLRVANGVYYLKLEIGRARAVSRIALIK